MLDSASQAHRFFHCFISLCRQKNGLGHTFSVSFPPVNATFREFCNIVVDALEPQIVHMPSRNDVKDHVHQFEARGVFPQGFGLLDDCHVKVSQPKEHALNFHN